MLLLRGWKIGELDEWARLKDERVDEVPVVGSGAEDEEEGKGRLAREAGRRKMVGKCLRWRKV